MSLLEWISLATCIAIGVYLLVALLLPEKFQ